MSNIKAYDIKAKKIVSMKNPQPYLMKNGSWALRGTSAETGINLFKKEKKNKPEIHNSRFDVFRNIFISRKCECSKEC